MIAKLAVSSGSSFAWVWFGVFSDLGCKNSFSLCWDVKSKDTLFVGLEVVSGC